MLEILMEVSDSSLGRFTVAPFLDHWPVTGETGLCKTAVSRASSNWTLPKAGPTPSWSLLRIHTSTQLSHGGMCMLQCAASSHWRVRQPPTGWTSYNHGTSAHLAAARAEAVN